MPTIAGQYVSPADCMLRCPCCRRQRDIDEYQTFLRQINAETAPTTTGRRAGRFLNNYFWHLARHEPNRVQWACDECLDADRATAGAVQQQDHGAYDPPCFAYYDQAKTCRDCGAPFTFSRQEQRHWYETLRFRVDVTRIRCRSCTERKHVRAHLSRLLIERDYTDLARTRQIIDLYVQLGQFEAAKRYLSLSRHAFAVGSPEYRQLGEWRAEVKQQEQAATTPPPNP